MGRDLRALSLGRVVPFRDKKPPISVNKPHNCKQTTNETILHSKSNQMS